MGGMSHRSVPRLLGRGLTGLAVAAAFLPAASAVAVDISDTRYAALDQPQIYTTISTTDGGDPLVLDSGGDATAQLAALLVSLGFSQAEVQALFPALPGPGEQLINVTFYYDTGASGNLLSDQAGTALGTALDPVQFNPGTGDERVVLNDIGVGGVEPFHVTPEVYVTLANATPSTDLNNPAAYDIPVGPIRFQREIPPADLDLFDDPLLDQLAQSGGINVLGMPAMLDKVVVMDVRPANAFVAAGGSSGDILDTGFIDATMRTYVYDPAEGYNPGSLDADPGIVPTDLTILLDYGDFGPFVELTPDGAEAAGLKPTIAHNPFIGPAPVPDTGETVTAAASSAVPQVALRDGTGWTYGSFLFDTGGAVSLLSTARAADLGYTVENGVIMKGGNPVADQFSVDVTGVGGTVTLVGTYFDELVVPTTAGDGTDPTDPNHLHYHEAGFFILDLTIEIDGEPVTLDGVIGMDKFMPSAEIENLLGLPFPTLETTGPFNWVVFDEPAGEVRVQLVPEPHPGLIVLTAATALALLRRRRAPAAVYR